MGKKGKGNKLAKMSEEERARYLQLRADIEEEARRRKMQLIALYMKNKLKREDAFCRLNMAKINQEWRSILRQVKCEELRNEMLEVEKFFKEAVDRKDRIIKRLLNDLDVAEDMYATLQQSHMENINKLIATQQLRTKYFKEVYEMEKSIALQQHEEDAETLKKLRDHGQDQLECVKCQLDEKSEKEFQENYERYLEKLDDIKASTQLRLEEITRSGEEKLENLWKDYQEVLSGYVRHTEGFYTEYMNLKECDDENTAIIRAHCLEIEKATDQLAHLKLVAAETEEKNQAKLNYLQGIKDDLSIRLADLKMKVDNEIKENEDQMKLMSVESHYALKHLQKIAKKGEMLLKLANACSAYETEREKILPLGLPPLTRLMFEATDEQLKQPPEALKDLSFGQWKQMENFWRRVNNATVDVSGLKSEKKHLEDENARLKTELQEYLINLNITNGSNTHVNDFLSNRPSSMRVDRVSQMGLADKTAQSADVKGIRQLRPLTTCIEANLTNAVRSELLARAKPKLAKIETIVRQEVKAPVWG